jgi:hypothetical protein
MRLGARVGDFLGFNMPTSPIASAVRRADSAVLASFAFVTFALSCTCGPWGSLAYTPGSHFCYAPAKLRSQDAPKTENALYFNLTKSRTKIAHIPTVIGYVANCASRSAPPRGIANVSASIARAVSIPSTNFIEALIVVPPHPLQVLPP